MKCTVETDSGGMVCIPSFMKIGTGVQAILTFCFSNLMGCNVGITDEKFMNYSVELGLGVMIYIPSCIKTSSGTQMEGGGAHEQTDRKVIS
jgi:hypothetical protein